MTPPGAHSRNRSAIRARARSRARTRETRSGRGLFPKIRSIRLLEIAIDVQQEVDAAGGGVTPDAHLARRIQEKHRVVGARLTLTEIDHARGGQRASRGEDAEVPADPRRDDSHVDGNGAGAGRHAALPGQPKSSVGPGREGRGAEIARYVARVDDAARRDRVESGGGRIEPEDAAGVDRRVVEQAV